MKELLRERNGKRKRGIEFGKEKGRERKNLHLLIHAICHLGWGTPRPNPGARNIFLISLLTAGAQTLGPSLAAFSGNWIHSTATKTQISDPIGSWSLGGNFT